MKLSTLTEAVVSNKDVFLAYFETEELYDCAVQIFNLFGISDQGSLDYYGITDEDLEEMGVEHGPSGEVLPVDKVGVWAKTKPAKLKIIAALKTGELDVMGFR